ncbi:hypothetical protein PPTG_01285 [Phytophthora nicotianae INRA-310]|uniref:Uncharacterized protein n=1 Tax=Phytophthora nicotianae (strain INRA-310) TaxID=761204 RepID=W2R6R3_PHYN3|nr:hypothetical protein PPTG_01284 [Phytophthora nicotianae INRA-310]XP_008892775.1 hypothetical protein PPTG_01285 [Phytophthora nicotianae INRA-310]ETN20926.1 hypothetical protein PPTG_01284 [Phytophthora nicotianae INRA-310]ETN20927.1 hypothetical protein PPTG_01285 [Phytophthora nicotianae INRA-310]
MNVGKSSTIHQGDSGTNANGTQTKQVVLQGLQLLFHCEYLALVEYIECVVPIAFVTYKSVLEQLPNIVYYPGGAGNWGIYAVVNILVFAALEVMSFLMLNQFLQRKFAFSPLYQVAFVLETQVYIVQAKLFLSLVILLSYELAHLGTIYMLPLSFMVPPLSYWVVCLIT